MAGEDGSIPVDDRLRRIEARQDQVLTTVQDIAVHQRADYVRHMHLTERVDSLEKWQTWAVRVVLAAIVAAGIAALLAPV